MKQSTKNILGSLLVIAIAFGGFAGIVGLGKHEGNKIKAEKEKTSSMGLYRIANGVYVQK